MNDILSFVARLVELEDIIISEISQAQKENTEAKKLISQK
jgi:hypothetical protein